MIRHCPHLVLDDFLPDESVERIRDFAASTSDAMVASRLTSAETPGGTLDVGYRRSQVALDLEEVWGLLEEPLRGLLPIVRSELDIGHFPLGSIEHQMTVSRDGDFFKQHLDEPQPWTDGARMLTFVYYFQRDDTPFEGGHLRLYARRDGDGSDPSDEFVEIVPTPNTIIFFPSDWHHEVTEVQGHSEDRSDSTVERWTINGWFRAGDLGRPPIPGVTAMVRTTLASRVVPQVATGWAVRPTPDDVDRVLRARWQLADDDELSAEGDDTISIGGTRRILPIEPIATEILDALLPLHEEWAGRSLEPTAAYGLRVYGPGQGIDLHCERVATHVVSSLIVVDADVDEPYLMTIADGGRTHRIPLQPGQMILYEGARLPHGHLEPLCGRSATVLFLHYAPEEWDLDDHHVVRRGLSQGLIDDTGRLTTKVLLPPEHR